MRMVEYEFGNLPPVSAAERATFAALRDEDIDLRDMPEITDFSGFVRGESGARRRIQRHVEREAAPGVLAWAEGAV